MNMKMRYFRILLTGFTFTTMVLPAAKGQTYLETFGQNRIQYRKFDWKFFDTKHFRIYHYDRAGRDLARYVAEEAEKDVAGIEKKMGGQFPHRFNIVLYNNYDEYRQTNIGLKYESPLNENTIAGTLDLVGDKLVVYHTGQHTDLRRQIRMGMARVMMERMLFGENFRKMVKNSVSENLPPWVTDGYIAYIVDGWDVKANSDWKAILDAQPKAKFLDLSEKYPELAGKAFYKFVSEQYGENTTKSLLFTLEQKNSLNKGMNLPMTLNMKVVKAYDSCMHYYRNVFAGDAARQEVPDSTKGIISVDIPKDKTILRSIKVSPHGHDVAYVTMKDGEYQIYIQHTANEQERTPLLDEGRKDYTEQIDPDYPLMAWSNNGYKLAVLFRRGRQTRLRIYNSLKAKIENYIIPDNRFDRVLGMAFMEDDSKMVFSAIRKSQTDLYEFTIKGLKLTNITNDAWDDVQPTFISGGTRKGILFLSNRPAPDLNVPQKVNELPTGPMNVFYYDERTKSTHLLQCSNVTKGHVTQPIQYGSENFAYLYDSSGVQNKYVVMFARDNHNMDTAYAVPITNYSSNIINHQYNPASNEVADVVQEGNKYRVYFHELQMPGVNVQPKQPTPTSLSKVKPEVPGAQTMQQVYQGGQMSGTPAQTGSPFGAEIKGGNSFQSEFTDTTTTNPALKHQQVVNANGETVTMPPVDSSELPVVNDSTYIKMRAQPYRLSFKPDFFSVRLDNTVLFNQYQSFEQNGGQYSNPSLSALMSLSLNDFMENHRFTAGFQLPINFSGSTYFLQYQNFEHRVDWGILYLHSSAYYNYLITYVDNANNPVLQKEELGKTVTNMVQADFSYPLDRVRSIRFHTSLKEDNLVLKAQDTLSLSYDLPGAKQFWSVSRLEFVFDNTISPTLNIRNGFRYKFYGEYLVGLNNGNKYCYNFGTDFRYYAKIYKNCIWANRIAYAHSDGTNEVCYFLGGTDNWISPKYDNFNMPQGNYGFQALATDLRGYDQNARNGNNFAVINSEIRLPVLTTFLKRPVQSPILKNLQLVAFMDAGSAWRGFAPDTKNNSVSYTFSYYYGPNGQLVMPVNPAVVTLSSPNQSGLALGYGTGLRTTLLGYFLRCDVAWSIDGGKKPIVYFALGTDF
jgi:hypothetical protein